MQITPVTLKNDISGLSQVEDMKSRDPTFKPALVIVQVRSATIQQTCQIKNSPKILNKISTGGGKGGLKCIHQDEAEGC